MRHLVARHTSLLVRVAAACVLVAVIAFAVLPDDEPAPEAAALAYPGQVLGVTANSLDGDTAAEQDRARALGVGWLREEFRWPTIEPVRGRFDFRRYDRLMTFAAQRGLRVLPVLIQSPKWISPRAARLPTQLGSWQRFVARVMVRYRPGGTFWRRSPSLDDRLAPTVWEIWNEPYLEAFDDIGPRPTRYAELVRATVQTGRQIDDEARFITAAETSYETNGGGTRDWLRDLDAALPGFGAWVDLLAVHPYTPGDPLDPGAPREAQLLRFEDLQQTLVELGIGRRPMWFTEMGWSTCTVESCVSDEEQARYWRKALQKIAGDHRDEVEAVFPYRLTDIEGTGEGDSQAKFGLIRLNGERKPAFDVVRRAASQAAPGR